MSMHRSPETLSKAHDIYGVSPSSIELDQGTLPARESKDATSRFLITLDKGIGDALLVGLSAVDQIIYNDPKAYGKIDILCTPLQSQFFEYDPRINKVIQTDKIFACGPQVTEWLRGISLDMEAAQVIHFLQSRCYEAILPAIVAPGLYLRLHTQLMHPQVFKLAKNLLLQGSPSDIPMHKFIRQMVNKYFCKDIPAEFADRVFMLQDESISTLLNTAALLDQADIFVTGDTGVMHLASAIKKVRQDMATSCMPKNSVKIIAIFGGTNPDIWGDSKRTIIVGRGRREQRCFSPGFVKDMYNPKGKDLFDHVSPQQLAEAINSLL